MSSGIVRYTRNNPCPNCGGHQNLRPGTGTRCSGYLTTSSDGKPWAFCSREELAGNATFSAGASAYAHALEGLCKCGVTHGDFTGPRERLYAPRSAPQGQQKPERPQLDPDTLDAVFSAYLGMLPLRSEHAIFYASRGAGDLAVAREHRYGSLPLGYTAARQVVDTLVSHFGAETMQSVPGFYAGNDGRLLTHTATARDDAAIIPMRDENGRMIGLVRHYVKGSKPKYMMFAGGTNDSYTVAGRWTVDDPRLLVAIEGPHKAHVAAYYSNGFRFLGLMGTNLSDAHLAAIERMRPDVVLEALDADKDTNLNVEKARAKMHAQLLASPKLTKAGVSIMTVVWPAGDGKGLDDLLAAGRMPKTRTVPRRPSVNARKPHVTPEPGPVAPGRSLAEVQAESAQIISKFIQHRRTKHGRMKLMRTPPGVGKTTAATKAIIKYGSAARILVSTKEKAAEIEAANPQIRAVEGRNAQNCQNIDVVNAARQKGYDVSLLVCRQPCPYIDTCRSTPGGYYAQFKQRGALAGTVELLYSKPFMDGGDLVVLDDPSLERAMIDTRTLHSDTALQIASAVPAGPTRELMTIAQRAIDSRRAAASFAPPEIGAHAWDVLAQAAGGADLLVGLVRACPNEDDILPAPSGPGPLSVEDIEHAPDAVLAKLVRLLKSEVDAYDAGHEFNSGLSIHPGGLEMREARPMLVDENTGKPLLHRKALLTLDATPLMPLYDRLTKGMTREPIYAPEVTLPSNVAVTQVADGFYGKTSVERRRPDTEGQEGRRPGRDGLLASLAEQRRRYPGDREAAICSKGMQADVIAAGFDPDRVLTFYGSRGLNSIEDADVLHVLGRPQAPDHTALQLAHVLHKGEAPILPHMVMRSEPYAGYRAADGTGRAITVLDFSDERASAIFQAYRESELLQAVHRARLFRVGSAQVGLWEPLGQSIARKASERRQVRLVIHSAHPIPGLRVDELIYSGEAGTNERRAVEAAERIIAACQQLIGEGVPLTVNAVARVSGANKQTVSKVMATPEFVKARFTPLIGITTTRGVNRPITNFGTSAPKPAAGPTRGVNTSPPKAPSGDLSRAATLSPPASPYVQADSLPAVHPIPLASTRLGGAS